MIGLLKKYWHGYKLKQGLDLFEKTGTTTPDAYQMMRQMFVSTRGESNDRISATINKKVGKYQHITTEGVLGKPTDAELNAMVDQMKRDGFYIFDKTLPDSIVDEIYNFAVTEPVNYLDKDTQDYSPEKIVFDLSKPISARYQFDDNSIVKLASIQNLIFDQTLLAFAQKYLGVKPILDLLAFWWSAPFSGEVKSAAAQMYHFDMDRIKFMKFFFYLTDVDTNTGPHCYVKGSHTTLPASLARDGRFTDEEIEQAYGKQNMLEICGKRGTIIAVDTRGFHKGKELVTNSRLLFQIEFANSMFGQTYPPVQIKYANDKIKSLALQYPYTYGQLLIEKL
ncbi:phytanoyl-CoA dioxygenase family protein [Mucilaginibacter sp. AW1-3]